MMDDATQRMLDPERPAETLAAKAIRAQLAAEADRDRLARKLDATVRVRNDAIEALDTMQIDRDRLAAEVAASDGTARRFLAQRQEMASERYEWQERALRAEAAIDRVRALHVYNEDAEYCNVCADGGDIRWPCATIAALDGVTS